MKPSRMLSPATAAAVAVAVAALGAASPAWGQGKTIYSCTDAQGRRITSDQPIPACLDRPQQEYGPSGVVRRVRPPTPTAIEQEQQQEQQRQAALERQRERDAIRRDQALVARYPDQAAHEAERRKVLRQSERVIEVAQRHIAELDKERKALALETEFYNDDPARAPAKLRQSIADNAKALGEQQRAIEAQRAEQARINKLFDEEAQYLKTLWAGRTAPAARTVR